MSSSSQQPPLRRRDYFLLAGYCLLLFGLSLFGGRVLTLHEARLPQTSREMMADHDWLVPKSGGRPWMERPPLPHWITVAVASLFGRCDEVWIVRIPPTLMATAAVLLLAWMMGRWYGRTLGLLSGFILATSFQFVRYAWLAEEEAFLVAGVNATLALFVRLQWPASRFAGVADSVASPESASFLGLRPWGVLAFFVALGATNLIKGLFFAPAILVVITGGFLLWNRNRPSLRRFLWLWGWLAAAAVALAWMVAAALRYPEVLDIMGFDAGARASGSTFRNPAWFYFVAVLWELLPWTLPALVGLATTRRTAFGQPGSPERFLWCWALLPMILLSLPAGKHHHYLLPALPAWAGLAALGAVRVWHFLRSRTPGRIGPLGAALLVGVGLAGAVWLCSSRIPGPSWTPLALMVGLPVLSLIVTTLLLQSDGRIAAGGFFGVLALVFTVGHLYTAAHVDMYRADTEFLREVRAAVPEGESVYVIADPAVLEPFRQMFYLGDRARLLHNVTFLRAAEIRRPEVYVVARLRERKDLMEYGDPELLGRSRRAAKDMTDSTTWGLFRLRFHPNLTRLPGDVSISPAQAYGVKPGPYLGPHREKRPRGRSRESSSRLQVPYQP